MACDSDSDDRDQPPQQRAERAAAFERRASALRANLKRRKAQLRGRAATEAASEGSDDDKA